MEILLQRFSYSPTETEGHLYIEDQVYATIEKPWKDNKPFASCIPEGEYEVEPFTRPNGDSVYRLVGGTVYRNEDNIPKGEKGRYLILLHSANFERQVVGCIAPGIRRGIIQDPTSRKYSLAVIESRKAMNEISAFLGRKNVLLTICQISGTNDGKRK